MERIFQNRSNLFATLFLLAGLLWLAAGSGSKLTSREYTVPEVDLSQAKALVDAGAIVIDVRGSEQFAYRHLPGAILIPIAVLRSGIPPSLSLAKEKPIVVYCNKGLAHGPEATHLLREAGFSNAVNMKSGIEGWSDSGLPITKG